MPTGTGTESDPITPTRDAHPNVADHVRDAAAAARGAGEVPDGVSLRPVERYPLYALDQYLRYHLDESVIGGGEPYRQWLEDMAPATNITEEDADVVVSTPEEFADALDRNEFVVIWIADDARIDLSGREWIIDNAWVCGDRGIDGSAGPLLYSTDRGEESHAWEGGVGKGQLLMRGDSRLYGIRLRGWAHDSHDNPAHPGYIPLEDPSERREKYALGVRIQTNKARIDNCEIYGWASMAVRMGSRRVGFTPRIVANDFHDQMQTSLGYHVDVVNGNPEVIWNYMNASRHAVVAFGFDTSEYVVEENVFGPATSSHVIDVHGLHNNFSSDHTVSDPYDAEYHGQAGGEITIQRNTFVTSHVTEDANFDTGRPTWACSLRGIPWPRDQSATATIERNSFVHLGPQDHNYGIREFNRPTAVNQQTSRGGSQGYEYPDLDARGFSTNVDLRDNHYGNLSDPCPEEYGAGVDLHLAADRFDVVAAATLIDDGETVPDDTFPDPGRGYTPARTTIGRVISRHRRFYPTTRETCDCLTEFGDLATTHPLNDGFSLADDPPAPDDDLT